MTEQAEIVIPYPDPLQALSDELNAYYDKHELEHTCALEMFNTLASEEVGERNMTERLRIEHMKYLAKFIDRWDEAEESLRNVPNDLPKAD